MVIPYSNFFGNVEREYALQCVGPGWAILINHLYDVKPEDTVVEQVKEKFGGLRFYTSATTLEFAEQIEQAEAKSNHICEQCGAPGSFDNRFHWIKVLCNKHKKVRTTN